MTLSDLLNRLDKVKQKGSEYKALCPAHDDKSPSLAVTEKDNKLLLKCWAGCSTEEITSALGIELKDLFTDSGLDPQQRKQYRQQKSLKEYLELFDHELMIICQAVNIRLYTNQVRSEENKARELVAARRIIKFIGRIYE